MRESKLPLLVTVQLSPRAPQQQGRQLWDLLVDPDTVDPNTGEKLFLSVDSDGNTLDSYERMQSSDNCVVAAIVLAKETKKLLRVHFADFFKFANDIAKHGLPAHDGEPALKPFKIIGSVVPI